MTITGIGLDSWVGRLPDNRGIVSPPYDVIPVTKDDPSGRNPVFPPLPHPVPADSSEAPTRSGVDSRIMVRISTPELKKWSGVCLGFAAESRAIHSPGTPLSYRYSGN